MSGALERLNANLVNAADAVPGELLAAAKVRVDELIAIFDEATQPSRHSDVVAALARLRHASATLGQALARAHQIVAALAAFVTELQLDHPIRRTLPATPTAAGSADYRHPAKGIAAGTTNDTSNVGLVSPASTATLGRPGDAHAFDPQPHLDDMPLFVRDRRRRTKTHGRWTDGSGATHQLLSGEHDQIHVRVNQRAVAAGLIPAGASLAAASDVELKFAQTMWETWERTGTTTQENIVINKPEGPCEGRLSCDGLLERYLPPGSELTVYWPGGQRTYRGGIGS